MRVLSIDKSKARLVPGCWSQRVGRPLLDGSVNSLVSLIADLDRPGPHFQSQLPGAASYSHCRPSAVAHDRQLPGELKVVAAILEAPAIERILTLLGLHAGAPPADARDPGRGPAAERADRSIRPVREERAAGTHPGGGGLPCRPASLAILAQGAHRSVGRTQHEHGVVGAGQENLVDRAEQGRGQAGCGDRQFGRRGRRHR